MSVASSLVPEPSLPAEPAKIEIERIGDEELLELLENEPAALVQLPDGERRLMLVVGSVSGQP